MTPIMTALLITSAIWSPGDLIEDPSELAGIEGGLLHIWAGLDNPSLNVEGESPSAEARLSQSASLSGGLYLIRSGRGGAWGLMVEGLVEDELGAELSETRSEYMVNERRFTSLTPLSVEYLLLRDMTISLLWGRAMGEVSIGAALRLKRRDVEDGREEISLKLESIHGEEINPNDPRQLIPALVDNLRYSVEREGETNVERGTSLNLDLAVGFRPKWAGGARLSFVLSNLLSSPLPRPEAPRISLKVRSSPLDWLGIETGFEKGLGEKPTWTGRLLLMSGGVMRAALEGGAKLRGGDIGLEAELGLFVGSTRFGLAVRERGGSLSISSFF